MFFAGSSWVEHLTWHRDLILELVRCFGGWKVLGEGAGVCTLLGPEGPDADPQGFVSVPLGLLLFLLWGK